MPAAKHLFAMVLLLILACTFQTAWSQTRLMDNGIIRIGIDLNSGGAISHLVEMGSYDSAVNIHDLGRYIQQSYYSGPTPFIPPGAVQHPAYPNWSWNPVQAGEAYNHRSEVIDESSDGTTLYVKCIPKQWALYDVDSECTMETWITLDENRVHVRNVLTNYRSDTTRYPGHHQELPAVYTVGTLHRLFTYTGLAPFTGDDLTQIDNNGPPWAYWNSTENWSALVDDDNWGLGIFHPGAYLTVGGFHGTPGIGGPSSVNTGYIAPLHTDVLDHDIVYEFRYTLILGDLNDDIRSYVYSQAPSPGPNLIFSKDRQHCIPANLTEPSPAYDGHWPLTLDHGDPMIILPTAQWQAEDVPEVLIRAAYRTQNSAAEIFFAGADGAFTGEKRLTVPVIPDGEVRTYAVDLASHPLYEGTITRLRFDPIWGQVAGDEVDLLSITTIDISSVPDSGKPTSPFVLEANYPNPFNPSTTIRYQLDRDAMVSLCIFDSSGKLVRVLESGIMAEAGQHVSIWDGRDTAGRGVASGAYFFRLSVEGSHQTGKMLLVR